MHQGFPELSPSQLTEGLAEEQYLLDDELAVVLSLALTLGRPLLVEGEPGVGKSELARALSATSGSRLIRLQYHEVIVASQALYDWDHLRQLLYLRTTEGEANRLSDLYSEDFLVARPLLDAITCEDPIPPVLQIDEIDRADDEFEAFLLEVLGDFQVTIPEIGTLAARRRPAVILTSNRQRELSEALRRRCLYHWLEPPSVERELAIIRMKLPGAPEQLARQAAARVGRLRQADLIRPPGIGETIDWLRSLLALGVEQIDESPPEALGSLLKHREDIAFARGIAP